MAKREKINVPAINHWEISVLNKNDRSDKIENNNPNTIPFRNPFCNFFPVDTKNLKRKRSVIGFVTYSVHPYSVEWK